MALYMDEAEIWKCPTHPSKRRRTGICPTCLRERLSTLCPNCAAVRPCSCCPATTSSSSSSSSSSFSLFYTSSAAAGKTTTNLLDGEPSFIRSRSLAIPFLRSRSRYSGVDLSDKKPPTVPNNNNHVKTSSFLSLFKTNKSKKSGGDLLEDKENEEAAKRASDFASMLNRSRSVSVTVGPTSSGPGELTRSSTKRRGWHFPSPMKAFRQSKTNNRFVQDIRSSPMCRV